MNLISVFSCSLKFSSDHVVSFLKNASIKYKVYKIPKRTHGFRVIAQPSHELKKYQYIFLLNYKWPLHQCALGYRKNASILDNAKVHVHSNYLLKLDLQDFFLRITPDIFWRECEKNAAENYVSLIEHKQLINQLLFWSPSRKANQKLVLSIGAPTSPMISNFCMYSFDERVASYCNSHSIRYTRYADDLTFSSNNINYLKALYPFIKQILTELFSGSLCLNDRKTVLLSKRTNRHVTGLTLTNDGLVSIGRSKKRWIKGLVYRYTKEQLTQHEISHLAGWLAYIQKVEPTFLESLKLKYTVSVIQEITKRIK